LERQEFYANPEGKKIRKVGGRAEWCVLSVASRGGGNGGEKPWEVDEAHSRARSYSFGSKKDNE